MTKEKNNKVTVQKEEVENSSLPAMISSRIDLDFPARISSQLFSYGKYRWNMDVRPFRLLMMVTQTLAMEKEPYPTLFPEYHFPLNKVFEYMGVSNNNKRYDLLIKDSKDLMSTVVEVKSTSKRGKFIWKGMTLISSCEIDEASSSLVIQINENSREYLVGMHRWAELQPRIYLKLSTKYQNWFYSYFQKEIYLSKKSLKPIQIIVNISTLKEMLYLDDVKTYDPDHNNNANEKFFSRIIGITKPKGWKYNKDNENLNTPWDYVQINGRTTGTLYTITAETDIDVSAYPIKEGRPYTKICFTISYKKEYLTKTDEYRYISEMKKYEINDMGTPTRKGRSSSKEPHHIMQNMFENPPVLDCIPNPITEDNLPVANCVVIDSDKVDLIWKEYCLGHGSLPDITKEEYFKRIGYTATPDGHYIKKINNENK